MAADNAPVKRKMDLAPPPQVWSSLEVKSRPGAKKSSPRGQGAEVARPQGQPVFRDSAKVQISLPVGPQADAALRAPSRGGSE